MTTNDQNNDGGGGGSTTDRDTASGTELVHMSENAGVLAQQAIASVQARYVMALKRPRNWDQARQDMLKECARPSFAKVARYRKPVGEGIEGPSIRFAEAALRYMKNVIVETPLVRDDAAARVLRVTVTDLETNLTYWKDVTVPKTVERRQLGKGQLPISKRHNSYGDLVYLVPATDDQILNTENALVSKAIRTCALRLLPGDILDECMEAVVRTQRNEDAKDPDAARKALVDTFGAVGVRADDLSAYLAHDLGVMTPAELLHLRALFAALRDGEATWAECFDASPYRKTATATAGGPNDPKPAGRVSEVAAKVQARAEEMRKKAAGGKAKAAAVAGPPAAATAPAQGAPTGPASGGPAPPADPAPPTGRQASSYDPTTGELPPDQEPPEPGSDG